MYGAEAEPVLKLGIAASLITFDLDTLPFPMSARVPLQSVLKSGDSRASKGSFRAAPGGRTLIAYSSTGESPHSP